MVPTLHPSARFQWQRLQQLQSGLKLLVQSGTPVERMRVSVASTAMLRAGVTPVLAASSLMASSTLAASSALVVPLGLKVRANDLGWLVVSGGGPW